MNVVAVNFNTRKEVSTTKQIPSKLDDAFSMCGDLSLRICGEFFWEVGSGPDSYRDWEVVPIAIGIGTWEMGRGT
jgi:hypothetical protein